MRNSTNKFKGNREQRGLQALEETSRDSLLTIGNSDKSGAGTVPFLLNQFPLIEEDVKTQRWIGNQ
ncbi:MAG: hypothetical protein QNJ54_00440 [Prochloraceae cyanobacterium]|nr:hypothetical protein [Prochloraceae cyanobacterium]